MKPEFFTSEDIVELSPLARLLYIGLWCEADREGRMVWKPKTFKIRYLPADDCDIAALCAELVDGGLVELYGDGYAYIPAFLSHQHINPRETPSGLPEPARKPKSGTRAARVNHASATREPPDSDATVTHREEGKGREWKGMICDAWRVPSEWIAEAATKKSGVDWNAEAERFLSHHLSKGSTFRSWKQAWWTWVNSPYPKTTTNGQTHGQPAFASPSPAALRRLA